VTADGLRIASRALAAGAFAGGTAGLLMFAFERLDIGSGTFRILLAAAIPAALVLGAQRLGWLPRRRAIER
jgi:hypothetical protein